MEGMSEDGVEERNDEKDEEGGKWEEEERTVDGGKEERSKGEKMIEEGGRCEEGMLMYSI